MGTYNPPIDQLLKLGRPDLRKTTIDYLALGIGPEHVPTLLQMLTDESLNETEPEWYAQVHAWRAIEQLRPKEAIEPLLDLVAKNAQEDDSDDWAFEDLPRVLGAIGPQVIPVVVNRLDRQNANVTQQYARVLEEVGKQHPEARAEVVSHLCRLLETASTNDATLNAFLISNLINLKATEAWPAIERAYATDNIDLTIHGGLAEAKFYMGLGPQPQRTFATGAPAHRAGPNAKQRFNERQRQKKLAKKQNKKKRKG